jgi:hypothetical protein
VRNRLTRKNENVIRFSSVRIEFIQRPLIHRFTSSSNATQTLMRIPSRVCTQIATKYARRASARARDGSRAGKLFARWQHDVAAGQLFQVRQRNSQSRQFADESLIFARFVHQTHTYGFADRPDVLEAMMAHRRGVLLISFVLRCS